jgi:hypothetical protein
MAIPGKPSARLTRYLKLIIGQRILRFSILKETPAAPQAFPVPLRAEAGVAKGGTIIATKEECIRVISRGRQDFPGVAFLLFGFAIMLSGCLGQGTYRVVPDRGTNVTIQTLMKNWQDYTVYYTGLDAPNPSAVLFEPKNGDRVIKVDRWSKVENRKLLADLIDSIQRQVGLSAYYPRLFEIRCPDGHLYGFMFTAWDVVSTRMVDDHTMFVFDIPLSPYLAVGGGTGMFVIRKH